MTYDRRARLGEFPALQLLLAWAAVSAILFLAGLGRLAQGQFPDPDDVLRLVQVRDLLAGQEWFDTTQYRIDPPAGTAMHWTRLVDIPLALVIGGLTPLLGQAAAETVALVAVPLLTFGLAAFAIGRLAWRMLGARAAIFAVLACGFLPALLFQFRPMRIDHHGWQIVSVAFALWAISWRDTRKGGWVAGLAMAFGLSISLEILPLAGAFGAILFSRWWLDHAQRGWLVAYMQALSGGLVVFYLATRGPAAWTQYCDAISPAHLGFFLTAALGTWILAKTTKLRGFGLIVLFSIVGAAALAVFAMSSPTCLTTPFAALDPAVDALWYRRVLEGQPLWSQEIGTVVPAIIQMLAAIGATIAIRARSIDWVRGWWTEYLLLLVLVNIAALLVVRSLGLASIIAAIPLGWLAANLLDRVRREKAIVARVVSVLALVILLAPMTPVTLSKLVAPQAGGEGNTAAKVQEARCAIRDQAERLGTLPQGTVFAPLDIGPTILLKSHHSVIATGHHRANEAMADVIHAFTKEPAEARAIVAEHDADYLALCSDLAEANLFAATAPDGLAAQLVAGNPPAWLEPVDLGGPEEFQVYRVAD
ncbi:hypothetical protein [Qipengyuania xiapuensis]|uniref:hypothetical protein n=1 Tax=Qipengyuania xiapuensis TaxID=2867236 RepID=UPI001FFC9C70|nr:hypothetical protein [Qipengyuania xiapuensis]